MRHDPGPASLRTGAHVASDRFLPSSTKLFLLLIGLMVAAASFIVVLSMPDLRAGESSHADGVLVAGGEPLAALLASWLGGTEAALRAGKVLLAAVVALPLLWLPLAIARIFGRARAGYALLLLPALMWLLNNGTILVGTELGLFDEVSGARVPVVLGLVGSSLFLALSVTLLLSTYRLALAPLAAATGAVAVAASFAALTGWLAGLAAALPVAVLWWLNVRTAWRWVAAPVAAAAVCAVALGVHAGVSAAVAGPGTGQLIIVEPATTYLPSVLAVIKHFGAMISFVAVGFVLVVTRRGPQRRPLLASFAIAIPAVVLGLGYATIAGPSADNYSLLAAALGYLVALALGSLVWSITSLPSHVRSVERSRLSSRWGVPAQEPERSPIGLSVIVPTRNGAEVLPETLSRLGAQLGPGDEIIVVENGSTDDTTAVVERIRAGWDAAPEFELLHSAPGLGEALRTGVAGSRGGRLLLTADDLPFGFTDLEGFRGLPERTAVAIGSKAHPDSVVERGRLREIQSGVFRFLRSSLLQSRVGDSQGTIWVDGAWGREFARLSRESGLMWTTELVLAAEQQGHVVAEVPVTLSARHEAGASRFRFRDAGRSVIGFMRLAIYKDDYCNEDWGPSTRAEHTLRDA